MEEKYYLSRNQYNKMEAPTLKGTKLNMAIEGLDFSGLSKTLVLLHQQARDVAKLELCEYRTLLAITRVAKKWEFIETHNGEGNSLHEFLPPSPADMPVKGKEDDEKVMALGRVNFCQKHPNMSADDFYCFFGCTDQPQKISE